jgi:hypothetical protein
LILFVIAIISISIIIIIIIITKHILGGAWMFGLDFAIEKQKKGEYRFVSLTKLNKALQNKYYTINDC